MSRPPIHPDEVLSDLVVFVRLDRRRAAIVRDLAEVNGIDNPEVIRRIVDFFIAKHSDDLASR